MFKESVEYNINQILPTLNAPRVTGSAFTQARYKVKPELFKELCDFTLSTYKDINKDTWKGHILIAGDGSSLNLPPSKDIEEHFGVYATSELGTKRYLARIFFLYDVLNDFVVCSQIDSMFVGEKHLLFKSLTNTNVTGSINILDRGFGHFCTILELLNLDRIFCIRLPVKNSNFAKNMLTSKEVDIVTEWHPSEKEKENCRANNLAYKPIKIRVVKVELPTGETELLVTNLLDQKKYTTHDMGELYDLRWGVEEGFKNLKPKMKIEQFGCRKTEGVLQEFYAHVFILNMVGLAGRVSSDKILAKTKHRRYRYKYNWKNAYRFLRAKLILLLNIDDAIHIITALIEEVSSSLVAVIPGRQFTRDTRHKNKKGRITQFNK